MDLTLAWASVGEIALAIHMSAMTSCHLTLLLTSV
jgi:hypothetical protein